MGLAWKGPAPHKGPKVHSPACRVCKSQLKWVTRPRQVFVQLFRSSIATQTARSKGYVAQEQHCGQVARMERWRLVDDPWLLERSGLTESRLRERSPAEESTWHLLMPIRYGISQEGPHCSTYEPRKHFPPVCPSYLCESYLPTRTLGPQTAAHTEGPRLPAGLTTPFVSREDISPRFWRPGQ